MTLKQVKTNLKKGREYALDAAGKTVGRLASQIAKILIGKNNPDYQPHIDKANKVIVLNANKVRFSGKKMGYKEYKHHSMHPGGLKSISASAIMEKNPSEAIRLAVSKMLPKNNMRTSRLLRLKFKV